MFTQLSGLTKALVFYALAVLLAVGVALAGGGTGLYMLTPLTAVMLMQFVVTRDGYSRSGWKVLGLHRPGVRAWPIAVLGPLVVNAVAYGLLWSTGGASFIVPETIAGRALTPLLPLLLLVGIVVETVTFSLGEELGWRGYLLPHLESLGRWPALVVSGLLHGIWHLPLILLTTLYHAEGNRLIVLPLFLACLTVAGVFLGYLRLRSGSVWPAALGHNIHNLLMLLFPAFTVAAPLTIEYWVGDTGILIAVGYLVVSAWLMRRLTAAPRRTVACRPAVAR